MKYTSELQSVSFFSPLRKREFLIYWLTGVAANFGWLTQMVGASWLMVSMGGSAEQVTLVQTALALPVMLFALPAGAVADVLGRKRIVIWSQSFLLVVSTTLAVLAYRNELTPWLLLLFTFLIGSGRAANNPGWLTKISEMMPRHEVPAAVALNSVGFNLARSLGPALGGFLVATVGAFGTFVVNAISNLGVLLVAMQWKKLPTTDDLPPEPLGSAILTGLRYVSMSPIHLQYLVRAGVFNLSAISVMALMPLIARDLVAGGPQTYGLLLGAFGLGAIGGAPIGARLRATISLETLVRGGFLLSAFAIGLMALSRNEVLTLGASALAGASWLILLSTFSTGMQMSSPRWVVGRCQALFQTVIFGANALGGWMWGQIAGAYGTPEALLISAGTLCLGGAVGFIFAIRNDSNNEDAAAPLETSQWPVNLRAESGPVIITTQYHIAPEDETEFFELMAARSQHLSRNGARRWTLSRDLLEPGIWNERFKTPNWAEIQRLGSRRTKAVIAIRERLHQIHQGEEPPKVGFELGRSPSAELRRHPPKVEIPL